MAEPQDPYDYDEYDDEFDGVRCWNCGGEGFVANCVDDGACIDPEQGCTLCIERCWVCAPLANNDAAA